MHNRKMYGMGIFSVQQFEKPKEVDLQSVGTLLYIQGVHWKGVY